MTLDAWVLAVDCCILMWLIATWFYEGHHRRCSVAVTCYMCGKKNEQVCDSLSLSQKKIELRYDPLAIDECCYPNRTSNDGA